MSTPKLAILGAAYGPKDVTNIVVPMINNDQLTVQASDAIFGDPWVGVLKTLVVIYQYGNELVQTAITKEYETMNITYVPSFVCKHVPGVMAVLGASYGLGEVTSATQALVKGNDLAVTASNSTFFDSWVGNYKTFVCVTQHGKNVSMSIAKEGSSVSVHYS